VSLVLDSLKERGDLVAKFAYANWSRQEGATRQMAENAVQMVQRIPSPRGDKNGADKAAVDAMRRLIGTVAMRGVVVIGEGEKDEAPMLFNGEEIGAGGPQLHILNGGMRLPDSAHLARGGN